MIRKATCCRGKCSIEVEGEPTIKGICHCRNCKKRTGSAFGSSGYLADAQILRKIGDFRAYVIMKKAESGEEREQQRWFCPHCGSTLFWKLAFTFPDQTGIAGGCFADNPLGEPSLTGNNDSRCAWVSLPDHWRTSL
jgi:hypothetical protein